MSTIQQTQNQIQTDTDKQQLTEQKNIKAFRDRLNGVKTNASRLGGHKKFRKKLKRWFDKCSKTELNNAQPGKLCYKIDTNSNSILLGRKKQNQNNQENQQNVQTNQNEIDFPYLQINDNGIMIHKSQNESIDVARMRYTEFYDNYYNIVIKGNFFTDLKDGFMSATDTSTYQEQPGSHKVRNTLSRILWPVSLPIAGLCKLDEYSHESSKKKAGDIEAALNAEYTSTENKTYNDLQSSIIKKWLRGEFPMSYSRLVDTLDANKKSFGNQAKTNLNTVQVNVANISPN